MTIHVNIGSNKGNRLALIGRAVNLISEKWGADAVRVSSYVESEPWGFDSPNSFVNVGVAIDTDEQMSPVEILEQLLEIEHSLCSESHRNPDGSYRDRHIDIDLIAVDDIVVDTPVLQLPHPWMHLREFVLRPLAELAPEWVHPVLGLTPSWMLERLAD